MNLAASILGKMAKGKPKRLSEQEKLRRSNFMRSLNVKRAEKRKEKA
jgi:hypothetical protein